MSNRLALALGLVLVTALALDLMLGDGAGTLFLLRRGFAFLQWLAFWR